MSGSTQLSGSGQSADSSTSGNESVRTRLGKVPAQSEAREAELEVDADVEAATQSSTRYVVGEFERYVQQQAGNRSKIRRFGSELLTGEFGRPGAEFSPMVHPDYALSYGDEVLVTLWGSVDADLRLVVDRGGRINIPRVGPVQVGGVRYADLADVVNRRVGTVFRSFQSSVTLGQLRRIRVFVTGFVVKPGAYTVSSLSSAVAALMQAGGPSAAGSFRNIELRRGGDLLARLDLYDLLLRGDRTSDRILQGGDVVHVVPVGVQVGIIGSVNKPSVIELKGGETVADALRMAAGFSAVADRSRLSIERLQDRNSGRVAELMLPQDESAALSSGDLLRAFSAVTPLLPKARQNKRVVIEGEVLRPGEYLLPPDSSISDALRMAGGFSESAYLLGTEFSRESVRAEQQQNYERVLRDLETELTRTGATQRTTNSDEATAQSVRASSTDRLIKQLRAVKPNGRVVLQVAPESPSIPDLALEDGDRLYIPPRPTTVGVFGSVFNGGSYLHGNGRTVGDYLRLAGGATRGADVESVFVVRPNGSVVGAFQDQTWFQSGQIAKLAAQPGDTIFVPEKMDKTTWLQNAKDWTQILSQFALGVAAFKVLGN